MQPPAFTLRPYQPGDQAAVFEIAADTAAFGAPVEAFLDDRCLFQEAFYAYYTRFEAQHSFVAVCQGEREEVVGFLMGCLDTAAKASRWQRRVLPGVISKALRGGYRLGRKTWRFATSLLWDTLRGRLSLPDLRLYPAHLHINVRQGFRGAGIGRKLITAYLEHLRRMDVPGVHLETTSENGPACHLYAATGFALHLAHSNSYWTRRLGRPVENRIYVRICEPA
jgi:ribosomal protein S18 acetylase RimI-like enzyme